MKLLAYFGLVLILSGSFFAQSIQGGLTVEARAGDTVAKLAERYGVDVEEVARYNGLLPHSVLGAGRKIKLPPQKARTFTTCQTKLSELPEIRGLKLGMSETEFF